MSVEAVLGALPPVISFVREIVPAIGKAIDENFNADVIDGWLKLASDIIRIGEKVPERIRKLNGEIEEWVAAGEAPPPEWWAAKKNESAEYHERIQAEAERRRS